MEKKNQFRRDTDIPPTEQEAMTVVDSMAQAATSFAGQGYEQFLYARDTVKAMVHALCSEQQKQK
jgi:hypothetical protein